MPPKSKTRSTSEGVVFSASQRKVIARLQAVLPTADFTVTDTTYNWIEDSAPAKFAVVNQSVLFTYDTFVAAVKALTTQRDATRRLANYIFESDAALELSGRRILLRIVRLNQTREADERVSAYYDFVFKSEAWDDVAIDGERVFDNSQESNFDYRAILDTDDVATPTSTPTPVGTVAPALDTETRGASPKVTKPSVFTKFFTSSVRAVVAKQGITLPALTFATSEGEESHSWINICGPAKLVACNLRKTFTHYTFCESLKPLTRSKISSDRDVETLASVLFAESEDLTGLELLRLLNAYYRKLDSPLRQSCDFQPKGDTWENTTIPGEDVYSPFTHQRPNLNVIFDGRDTLNFDEVELPPLTHPALPATTPKPAPTQTERFQKWATLDTLRTRSLINETSTDIAVGLWININSAEKDHYSTCRDDPIDEEEIAPLVERIARSRPNESPGQHRKQAVGAYLCSQTRFRFLSLDTRDPHSTLRWVSPFTVPRELGHLIKGSRDQRLPTILALDYSIFRAYPLDKSNPTPGDPAFDAEAKYIRQAEEYALRQNGSLKSELELFDEDGEVLRLTNLFLGKYLENDQCQLADIKNICPYPSDEVANGFTQEAIRIRVLGLAVRNFVNNYIDLQKGDSESLDTMAGGGKPAPRHDDDGNGYYTEYDDDEKQQSKKVEAEQNREMDLSKSNVQFYYKTIHARIKLTRLPPQNAQLEDADVYALLVLFQKKKLTAKFLHENYSGVFTEQGYVHPARRQMGRPAIIWSEELKEWRYVVVTGSYTLCGGGHLEKLMTAKQLDVTTKAGDRWPWQRPKTVAYSSASAHMKLSGAKFFALDMDIEVDWDAISWPDSTDRDRISTAFVKWVKKGKGVVSLAKNVPAVRGDAIWKPFDEGSGDESDYETEVTDFPMMGYAKPPTKPKTRQEEPATGAPPGVTPLSKKAIPPETPVKPRTRSDAGTGSKTSSAGKDVKTPGGGKKTEEDDIYGTPADVETKVESESDPDDTKDHTEALVKAASQMMAMQGLWSIKVMYSQAAQYDTMADQIDEELEALEAKTKILKARASEYRENRDRLLRGAESMRTTTKYGMGEMLHVAVEQGTAIPDAHYGIDSTALQHLGVIPTSRAQSVKTLIGAPRVLLKDVEKSITLPVFGGTGSKGQGVKDIIRQFDALVKEDTTVVVEKPQSLKRDPDSSGSLESSSKTKKPRHEGW